MFSRMLARPALSLSHHLKKKKRKLNDLEDDESEDEQSEYEVNE